MTTMILLCCLADVNPDMVEVREFDLIVQNDVYHVAKQNGKEYQSLRQFIFFNYEEGEPVAKLCVHTSLTAECYTRNGRQYLSYTDEKGRLVTIYGTAYRSVPTAKDLRHAHKYMRYEMAKDWFLALPQ